MGWIEQLRRRDPAPPGLAAQRTLGFDRSARFSFTSVSPQPAVPPAMDIFTVPANVSRAVVEGLAVDGNPPGQWYNNITWAVRIGRGGAQQYLMGSKISTAGATVTIADSGIRWTPLGSLQRPMPVHIELDQGQVFGLAILFINNLLVGARYTAYVRAVGVMFS